MIMIMINSQYNDNLASSGPWKHKKNSSAYL